MLRVIRVLPAVSICAVAMSFTGTAAVAASQSSAERKDSDSFCGRPVLAVGPTPPPFKARLGIKPKVVGVDGRVRLRVENLGTDEFATGDAYGLERRAGQSWVRVPSGPFYAPRLSIPPERAGPCQAVEIATHAVPGLYRISKKVVPASGGRRQVLIRVTFRVGSRPQGQ